MKRLIVEKFIHYCWTTEFQKGATVAALTIFSLILLYAVIRLLITFLFGRQRCNELIVEQNLGRIIVSKDAVESALRCELARFEMLEIRKILLFTIKDEYQLEIIASYNSNDSEENLGKLHEDIRVLLVEKLRSFFGVEHLSDVVLKIEHYSDENDMDDDMIPKARIPDLYVPTQRR